MTRISSLLTFVLLFVSLFLKGTTLGTDLYLSVNSVQTSVENPPTPPTPVNSCGYTTITHATPPTGVKFYWQGTNSAGTSVADDSVDHKVYAVGTYYLRARDIATGTWSAGSSFIVVSTIYPGTTTLTNQLSLSTLASPGEYNVTFDMKASGVTGGTYYWYNSSGTQIATGTNYNPNASAKALYKVKVNTNSTCWSNFKNIYSTRDSIPVITNEVTAGDPQCGYNLLNHTVPPAWEKFYWQGTNPSGTLTNDDSLSHFVNVAGTYYVRPKDIPSGTWGPSVALIAAPKIVPTTPVASNVTIYDPGKIDLNATSTPSNAIINWYDNGTLKASGEYTLTLTATKTFTVKGVLNGCASPAKSVTATMIPVTLTCNVICNGMTVLPGISENGKTWANYGLPTDKGSFDLMIISNTNWSISEYPEWINFDPAHLTGNGSTNVFTTSYTGDYNKAVPRQNYIKLNVGNRTDKIYFTQASIQLTGTPTAGTYLSKNTIYSPVEADQYILSEYPGELKIGRAHV
jgi:hypothetical protein